MKLFVAALVILALITGMCIWGTIASVKTIDSLLSTLRTDIGGTEIPKDAIANSKELLAAWERDFFLISMFLPHHHLDEIKEELTSFASYAESNEFAEWREAGKLAEESLLHIRGLMETSLDNIL